MAYDITVWFNDRAVDPLNKGPITILPGETVSDKTTLTLVGQGAMHYGKHVNENFLHLLENFASEVEPEFPTVGQLWWKKNTIEQTLMVCKEITGTGPKWVPVSTNYWSGPTPPPYNSWLWYDTSNPNTYEHQLKIFNELTGEWDSVARRYVLKTGDELTGNLKFLDNNEGLIGDKGGFTSVITASSPRGPSFISDKHASVTIGAGGSAPSGSEFVVGAFSREPLTSTSQSNRLVTINDSGVMQVHKNVLDMTTNKIVNLRDGTSRPDAVNYGQLFDVNLALTIRLDGLTDDVEDLQQLVDTKVSKFGDVMTGKLTINHSLEVRDDSKFNKSITVTDSTSTGVLNAATSNVTGTSTTNVLAVTTTSTFGGLASMEQPRTAITAAKHLTTKEYVDYMIDNVRDNTKVAKTGDTMSGGLTINSTLSASGAVNFGSSFKVGGAVTFDNTLVVSGGTQLNTISSMNVARSAITAAKHLTTKEYVDNAIAAAIASIPQAPGLDVNFSSENGYATLPGGLIIQWGMGATVTGNMDRVYFPKPFPNRCLQVVTTEGNAIGWEDLPDQAVTVHGVTMANGEDRKRFYYHSVNWIYAFPNGGGTTIYATGGVGYRWIAVGH